MKIHYPLLAALLLAGCTTPYPNGSPIYGARVSGNPEPRGSDAFCRNYARQTAGNQYEGNRDEDGGNFFEAERARRAGDRAYERCRAGRTG
jgi:hypothetical protein